MRFVENNVLGSKYIDIYQFRGVQQTRNKHFLKKQTTRKQTFFVSYS